MIYDEFNKCLWICYNTKNWVEYEFEYFPLHKDFNGIGVNFNVLLYYF